MGGASKNVNPKKKTVVLKKPVTAAIQIRGGAHKIVARILRKDRFSEGERSSMKFD